MPVVNIELVFDDKGAVVGARKMNALADAADKAQKSVSDISSASTLATKSISNAGVAGERAGDAITQAMKDAARNVIALVGAYKSLDAAMEFAKRGMNATAEWEQSKIGIASVLASVKEIRDEQGNLLSGADAYKQALDMAGEAMNRIKLMGLETTATSQELVAGFQQLVGPAAAAGLSMQQTLDFTMSMVQSLGAIGIPFNQLSAEARSLLDGTIVPTQDRLATTLGITGEMVKNWKQQGVLAQKLLEKMSAFSAAGDDVAKTWRGVTSNLQDAIDAVAMTASAGLYDNMKTALSEINALLVTTKGRASGINDDFKYVVETLEQIQTRTGKGILSAVRALADGAKGLNSMLGDRGVLNALQDISTAVKTAALALLGFLAAQKIATSVDGWNKHKVAIAESAKAAADKALASLNAARAALAEAKAEQQLWAAQSKTRAANKYAAQSTANLNRFRQEQVEVDHAVAVAERNLAAAIQSSAIANQRAMAIQQNGVSTRLVLATRMKSALGGLVNFLGGPWGITLTAAGAAIGFLSSRQSDAEKAANLHAEAEKNLQAALKGATDESGKLTKKLTDLERQHLDMARKQKESEYRLGMEGANDEIDNFLRRLFVAKERIKHFDFADKFLVPDEYIDTFLSMVDMFKSGNMSAEDFRDNIAALRDSLVDAGYGGKYFVQELDKLNSADGKIFALAQLGNEVQRITSLLKGGASAARDFVRAIPDSQIPMKEAREAAAAVEEGYKKTDAGRREVAADNLKKAQKNAEILKGNAKEYAKALAVVKHHEKELNDFEKRMAKGSSGGSGSSGAESARERIQRLREEIAQLNGEAAKSGNSLAQKEREIAKLGKEAGLSAQEIGKLQDDYSKAFDTSALKELNKELLRAEGNTKALQDAEKTESLAMFTARLNGIKSLSEDEKKIMLGRYESALGRQSAVKDAQTSLAFARELAQLSGNYGIEIEHQNKMLDAQAEIYRAQLGPELRALVDEWLKLKKMESARDPLSGSMRGLRRYANEATDLGKGVEDAWVNGFSAMEDAMTEFVLKDKMDFNSLANSIINDLTRIAIRSMITGPLASGLGSLFSGMFGGTYSAAQTSTMASNGMVWSGGSGSWLNGIHGHAKGGVLSGGNLSLYSNSVITSPTLFSFGNRLSAFASGAGLMGEAGPEAIMPLRRGANGRLGVEMFPSLGRHADFTPRQLSHQQITINFVDKDGNRQQQTVRNDGNSNMTIDVLLNEIDKGLAQRVSQGKSQTARALDASRGLNSARQLYN